MLYFDEAGYTGPDLTNKEQPYFALASIRMTDDEVACMKKDIGYCEWGKELHFKSMYTNPHGRVMLDKIFNHPLMDDNHVLPSFAYKRLLKTEDIHPPKTGISVHFSGSLV